MRPLKSLPEILEEKLPEIRKIMAENTYFTNLRVFGSIANGTATEDSDIDFLVSMKKECSYFEQIDLQNKIENVLGVKIDLIEESDLKPLVKRTIHHIRSV